MSVFCYNKKMIPAEFKRAFKKTSPKRRWPYVLGIILFLVIDAVIGYLIYKENYGKDNSIQTVQTPPPSPTVSAVLTQISSNTESADQKSVANTTNEQEEIRILVDNFMQARINRNLDAVKPYVTDEFLKKYDQAAFAGASSPSLSSYEVIRVQYIGSNTYQIIVQTKWTLSGNEAGVKDWTLIATKSTDKYLINDYSEVSS